MRTLTLITLLLTLVIGCRESDESVSDTKQLTPSTVCNGQHTCQSHDSIGHTCTNYGIFNDANEAYYKLKADSCCGHSQYGGSSIDFKVTNCMLM